MEYKLVSAETDEELSTKVTNLLNNRENFEGGYYAWNLVGGPIVTKQGSRSLIGQALTKVKYHHPLSFPK